MVRSIRRRQGRTLKEVAAACGCTVSFLSKFETGQSQASLNMLHRLASALEVNLSAFLDVRQPRRARVMRAAGRPLIWQPALRSGDGIALELLSGSDPGDVFQVNLHHVAPGGRSDGQITHQGDEFIYVLSGHLRLFLGSEAIELTAGDAVSFPSLEPHGYENAGLEEAVVLWLNTPPTF